jgi:SHS2 domain-containing protein
MLRRMREGFRTFDHTGDLGLEVWATDPARLYALAAEGLMAQVIEAPAGAAELVAAVELEGDDAADLLVAWLNAVLLESELRHAVWTRASITTLTATRLAGTLEGQLRDPGRHTYLREVKAVSHHALELMLEPGACRARLVLDI